MRLIIKYFSNRLIVNNIAIFTLSDFIKFLKEISKIGDIYGNANKR